MLHSNNLCVMCLDPSHVALQAPAGGVSSVSYDVKRDGKTRNRGDAVGAIVGKKKKNALRCQKDMTLALVTTQSGDAYKICPCIDGSVLEMNSNLPRCPMLLQQATTTEGYIAVINADVHTDFAKFKLISRATGSTAEEER